MDSKDWMDEEDVWRMWKEWKAKQKPPPPIIRYRHPMLKVPGNTDEEIINNLLRIA